MKDSSHKENLKPKAKQQQQGKKIGGQSHRDLFKSIETNLIQVISIEKNTLLVEYYEELSLLCQQQ